MYDEIKNAAHDAIKELLSEAKPQKGQIVVVGCSSSEIVGEKIGKGSTPEAANAVMGGILPVISEKCLY